MALTRHAAPAGKFTRWRMVLQSEENQAVRIQHGAVPITTARGMVPISTKILHATGRLTLSIGFIVLHIINATPIAPSRFDADIKATENPPPLFAAINILRKANARRQS